MRSGIQKTLVYIGEVKMAKKNKCDRNFIVLFQNRKLAVGDSFKNFKIDSKVTKACNPKDAFHKVMSGRRGFGIEVMETDKLISKTKKGKVIKITKFGDKFQ